MKSSNSKYSYHVISKNIAAKARRQSQEKKPYASPDWREDGYRWNDLDGFEVDFYYKRPKQKETIKQLTGNANYVEGFPGTDFLVRGHLAPVEDFMSNAYKDTTFFFFNSAPQWQSFNGANWGTLEDNIRNYVGGGGVQAFDAHVYTGTNRFCKLKDWNSNDVEIWLYPGNIRISHDIGICEIESPIEKWVPVPKFFWKVVLQYNEDGATANGVAFIGVNNPYIKQNELAAYTICTPVPNAMMPYNAAAIDKGFMYACGNATSNHHLQDHPQPPTPKGG